MDQGKIDKIVRLALKEDLGTGDITTSSLVPAGLRVEASILMRETSVVCGLDFVKRTFLALDRQADIVLLVPEGKKVKPGQVVARLKGKARAILSGERVALNFLGRLSGVATLTRTFVDAVRGTKAVILDTRKTTAGMRGLERYAVRLGGGANHRFDLGEMVLVKDNHRMLCGRFGSLAGMVRELRVKTDKPIEVEVDTLDELADVLREPPEMVLLDNMTPVNLRKAVMMVASLPKKQRPLLEASGGINVNNIAAIARTGVDRISIGALTHSARSVDVSLDMHELGKSCLC